MTERKTDVLNVRLDPGMAREIERIASWRGKTESEVARELLHFGVRVERDLEAQELKRHYTNGPVNRDADNVRIQISAELKWLSYRELADELENFDEEVAAQQEYEARRP